MNEAFPARRKVYPISPRRSWFLWGFLIVAVGGMVLGGLLTSEPMFLLVAGILFVILFPIFALSVWSARLILSTAGVELRQLGWRVGTPWENIERLDRGGRGLILREPLDQRGARTLRTFSGFGSMYDLGQQAVIDERRYIPLEPFMYWWHRGDLQREFREFAPQLGDAEFTTAIQQPAREPVPLRTWLIVAAISAPFIVIGLGLGFIDAPWVPTLIASLAVVAFACLFFGHLVRAIMKFRARDTGPAVLALVWAILYGLLALAALGRIM